MEKEANKIIEAVSAETNDKFDITIKAWDLDQSAGLVFLTEEQATKFHNLYKELFKDEDHMWNGMKMRLMKDTTFEEIMRRQLYYNIKE
eukprot:5874076-Heterocapsa_arctica.AAC.1